LDVCLKVPCDDGECIHLVIVLYDLNTILLLSLNDVNNFDFVVEVTIHESQCLISFDLIQFQLNIMAFFILFLFD
jgi:hypothetical protein